MPVMAFPERISPAPRFRIERNPLVPIQVETIGGEQIPHADLIQSMMNAGACVSFGLTPAFASEGGVEGVVRRRIGGRRVKVPIELLNLDQGEIGITNTYWEMTGNLKPEQQDILNDVLGYYDLFTTQMFEYPRIVNRRWSPPEEMLDDPAMQTREAVWKRVRDTLRNTGGGKFAGEVQNWLVNQHEASRRYLRGLTDSEIQQFFVDPPIE